MMQVSLARFTGQPGGVPVRHRGRADLGLHLSTGRVERHGGLFVFRGMPKWAFGRGGSCVGGCYLTDQNVTPDVLEHEAVHKRQWLRYGMLFPLLYLAAGRNPLKNRFEIEAGLEKGGYVKTRTVAVRAGSAAGACRRIDEMPASRTRLIAAATLVAAVLSGVVACAPARGPRRKCRRTRPRHRRRRPQRTESHADGRAIRQGPVLDR